MNIIIAGSGPAAVEAAITIRACDKMCSITLYTDEKILPYRRMMLIKALENNLPLEKLFIHNADFYKLHRINIVFNRRIIGIDWTENQVILNDFTREKYDRLLLANGMAPRRLPLGDGNQQTPALHSYDDLQFIRKILPVSKHIAVVGGGVLGCELSGAFLQQGKKVTLIERGAELLTGLIDPQCGNFLRQQLLKYPALTILSNARSTYVKPVAFERLCCMTGSAESDQVTVDTVFSAIGFIPQAILWQPAVKTDILEVDRFMHVKGFENIYAAGDCAFYPGVKNGSWYYAQLMGRIAGTNMIYGNREALQCSPYELRSSFMGIKLYIAGDTSGKKARNVIYCDQKKLKKLFYRNDKLVGFVLINDTASGTELYQELEYNSNHLS